MSEGVRSVGRGCQRLVDCRPRSSSSTSQVNGDGGRPPQPTRRGEDTKFRVVSPRRGGSLTCLAA